MQGIDMERPSQGCYNKVHLGFCDSHYNYIIDIHNGLFNS